MKKIFWVFIIICGIFSLKYELEKTRLTEVGVLDSEFLEICKKTSEKNYLDLINGQEYCSCIIDLMKEDKQFNMKINKLSEVKNVKKIYADFEDNNYDQKVECFKMNLNYNSKGEIIMSDEASNHLKNQIKKELNSSTAIKDLILDIDKFSVCFLEELINEQHISEYLVGKFNSAEILPKLFNKCYSKK